jgi:N-acetylglucosaminyldiphosphoundecaprenol N-acetyl-beta-D-mannosaminyltransferase
MNWPIKSNLFGVMVTPTHYTEVVDCVVAAAAEKNGGVVNFLPVHGIVTAATDPTFQRTVNASEMNCPDGQPVRWALNFFHRAQLNDRVYGPETMRQVCQRCAREGISIYLCGSTPEVIEQLREKLTTWYPALHIAGAESPPFRPLTSEENDALCDRINASGAGVGFIGLGCPRQEAFAKSNRDKIKAVQLCVGAAFDFHAGHKKMAPAFMQRNGMEWLFRLCQEPGRLWKRYLVTNSIFMGLVFLDAAKRMVGIRPVVGESA